MNRAPDIDGVSALVAYVAANLLEGNSVAASLAYARDADVEVKDNDYTLALYRMAIVATTVDISSPPPAAPDQYAVAAYAYNWVAASTFHVQRCEWQLSDADPDWYSTKLSDPDLAKRCPAFPEADVLSGYQTGHTIAETRLTTELNAITQAKGFLTSAVDALARAEATTGVQAKLEALAAVIAPTFGFAAAVAQIPATDNHWAKQLNSYSELFQSLASGDFARAATGSVAFLLSSELVPYASVNRLLVLSADVISADDAATVNAALKAAAAPPNTYRKKRRAWPYYLVNAYVGASYGYESSKLSDAASFSNGGRSLGVTLPIGFEMGTGCWGSKCGLSGGLFFQALDLGALATYRLHSSDSAKTDPNVGFAQVLAPGLFVAIGFPRYPISALFGADFVPQLRSVDTTAQSSKLDMFRASVRLAFDVPLFP